MPDKPTITFADLQKLQEQESKPTPLNDNEVSDYASAVLIVLRGLPRGEKLKVMRRAQRMLR